MFVANEIDQEVFFDQMVVEHIPQLTVQKNHYYPFGLELVGLNKKGKPEHRWKYHSQEEQTEFGLNWSSFKYRNADVALGRFFSVDPLAEQYVYNSTYAFSENKVTSHVELEGLESVKKNEQAQITKVVKHGSKAIKRLRSKGSGGGSFFPSSTPRSGDGPRNNIFPGNYTIGPNLTKAEREHYRKFGENLNFKILNTQINGPKNALEDLSRDEQQEYLDLEGKGVQNLNGTDLDRFRQLENVVVNGKKGEIVGNGIPTELYHYTTEDAMNAIISSGKLRPSLIANNPKDARYGDGQYFTDIVPGTRTPPQLSYDFLRVPWGGKKFSHYIKIDVRGLNVIKGRDGVYVVLGNQDLDISKRINGSGKVPSKK